MFLPFYPFEDWFGLSALFWAPVILFGALVLVPFLDRSPYRSPGRRRVFVAIGTIVAVAAVALVVYAMITVPEAHIQEAM